MNQFFSGVIVTLLVGIWIWALIDHDTYWIVASTIMLLVATLRLGAYLEEKYGGN